MGTEVIASKKRAGEVNKPAVDPVAQWTTGGPGLFSLVFVALGANAAVLIYAIYGETPGRASWATGFWIAFSLMAALGMVGRALFFDYLITIPFAGRVLALLMLVMLFLLPRGFRGHSILPEGFLPVMFILLPFAMNSVALRAFLAMSVLGFWCSLGTAHPPEIEVIVAFGTTLLGALAAAHFAQSGFAFGLRGWWPLGRVFFYTLLLSGPAALASYGAYRLWPEGPSSPRWLAVAGGAAREGSARARSMSTEEFAAGLVRLALWLALFVTTILFLHILRRYLSRKAKPVDLPQLQGADLSELEIVASGPAPRGESVGGNRAAIVKLWGRWAKRFEPSGLGRTGGETAEEMAVRLALENPVYPPSPEMTRLLEAARYGAAEPDDDDVQEMRRLVRDEMEKEL